VIVGARGRSPAAGAARPLRTLLVANRGEIAVRVIRAAREMGIRSVAAHAEDDAGALFVEIADDARLLPGESPSRTYLSAEAICRAALDAGADAVHPGYGFLAESAGFARAVREAGLVFVGPPLEAMALVGSKVAAKALAEKAGVPTVPWAAVEGHGEKEISRAAAKIGYPLLVKASAGGGGKGMRVVAREAELLEAVRIARVEAAAAFGDGEVFLERALSGPRHVEIQILGDAGGRAIAFPERECSIQRRHQKILEESPSVAVGADLRARLEEAAVAIAESSGYVGAGTVEFLLDAGGSFYFLEVNARLQVEHPVTEAVTGIDLVAWQLRLAAGEALPPGLSGLAPRGHAIECRLNAEDPAQGFLPSAGRIERLLLPTGPGVRVDTGVREGDLVATRYDPLIAKVIAWAEDRPAAIRRIRRALRETVLLGITSNAEFLGALVDHPAFARAETTTDFLTRHGDAMVAQQEPRETDLAAIALFEAYQRSAPGMAGGRDAGVPGSGIDPWDGAPGFRCGS